MNVESYFLWMKNHMNGMKKIAKVLIAGLFVQNVSIKMKGQQSFCQT